MKRPDRPLVPPERCRRPHIDAFADLTPFDESTLIERSQLLDAIADDTVDPMVIEIDRTKWEVPRNRLPPRHHSAEMQAAGQQTAGARRHRGIAGQ